MTDAWRSVLTCTEGRSLNGNAEGRPHHTQPISVSAPMMALSALQLRPGHTKCFALEVRALAVSGGPQAAGDSRDKAVKRACEGQSLPRNCRRSVYKFYGGRRRPCTWSRVGEDA